MQLLKRKFEITGIVWHHAVVDLFRDVSVEVHFYPIWLNNPWNNKYLQSWFRTMALGRCKREKDNLGYVCTTDEFDVVYQLAHCFHHLMDEGLGLRQVLDYYYMVKNCEKKTSDESFAIIRKIGLEKFAGAMMWVLREICLLDSEYYICEPNPKEGVFLMSEILEGGNMGCYRMDGKRKNTLARWWMMFKHYPSEVFWMVPWKIWQKGWLLLNKS